MKQSLTKKIEEILDKCESPVQLPEQKGFSGGKEWAIHALISAIKERDKEVLGEEAKLSINPNSPSNYAKRYANDMRFRIAERQKETL